MKLITKNTFKGSNTQGQALTIMAGASAFDALSSGIYSDKITAFIRELTCNAYDAWTQRRLDVGTDNASPIPFEIKLPNAVDPEFYIQDFGTGMDHDFWENELLEDTANPGIFKQTPVLKDFVAKHHATYFLSTKADDDGVTGGFGVGSKSPMTYTDLYVVENRKNGRKTVHHVYKEEAKPKITKKIDTATDEADGMTISFAIAEKDFVEVVRKTAEVLQYFPVQPRVLGATLPAVAYTAIRLSESLELLETFRKSILVMGNVAYPLEAFKPYAPKGFAAALFSLYSHGFRLTVPVGTAWPTLSRESLDMHDRTKQGLSRAFSKAESEVETAIIAGYTIQGTRFEKEQAVAKYIYLFKLGIFKDMAAVSFDLVLLEKLISSGKGLQLPNTELPFKVSVCYSGTSIRAVVNGRYPEKSAFARAQLQWHFKNPACIWIADCAKFKARLLQHYSRTGFNPEKNSFIVEVDLSNPLQKNTFEQWLSAMGNPPVRRISELAAPVVVKKTTAAVTSKSVTAKITSKCAIFKLLNQANGEIAIGYRKAATLEFKTGVPYVLMNKDKWMFANYPALEYRSWVDSKLQSLGVIAQALNLPKLNWGTVYGILPSMEKKFLALGCWPVEQPILDKLSDPIVRQQLADTLNHTAVVTGNLTNLGISGFLAEIARYHFKASQKTSAWTAWLASTKMVKLFEAIEKLRSKGNAHYALIKAIQKIQEDDSVFRRIDWSFLSDIWTDTELRQVLEEAYPLIDRLNLGNTHQLNYLQWCETQPHFKLTEIISRIGVTAESTNVQPTLNLPERVEFLRQAA